MTDYERLEKKIDDLTKAFAEFKKQWWEWFTNDWMHHCKSGWKMKGTVAYLVLITAALLLMQLHLMGIL